MKALLVDKENNREKRFDSKEEAEEQAQELRDLGADVEVKDISAGDDVTAEVVDHSENGDAPDAQADVVKTETISKDDVQEPDVVDKPTDPEELHKDPIGFLKSINTDFVNTIKGKPSISKQGFRFIQREFEISTESKVVQWIDDPTGCIIWAKAEHPNGYSAEAHGEGYLFESDVDDNEFVRYADTRAKNRAISDLTSAGALAVSELGGDDA